MAYSKTSILLLMAVAFTLASSAAPAEVERGPRLGGWQPIKNLDDKEIRELAKFALTEHRKLGGPRLEFERVLEGEQQVVAGMNYRLVLAATSEGKRGKYEAVVWVRPWLNEKKLTSFRSV
uniref:Cystatin domain-containing protein n=1 Tax=Kalanchoe fedtschenkoi TaxID=63787 RepID=A0A7N1A7N7_KALFE